MTLAPFSTRRPTLWRQDPAQIQLKRLSTRPRRDIKQKNVTQSFFGNSSEGHSIRWGDSSSTRYDTQPSSAQRRTTEAHSMFARPGRPAGCVYLKHRGQTAGNWNSAVEKFKSRMQLCKRGAHGFQARKQAVRIELSPTARLSYGAGPQDVRYTEQRRSVRIACSKSAHLSWTAYKTVARRPAVPANPPCTTDRSSDRLPSPTARVLHSHQSRSLTSDTTARLCICFMQYYYWIPMLVRL